MRCLACGFLLLLLVVVGEAKRGRGKVPNQGFKDENEKVISTERDGKCKYGTAGQLF